MSDDKNEPAQGRRTQGERDSLGRFRPGVSGNPAGMAPGTKRHRTRLYEQILDERGEELLQHAIETALAPRGGPTLRALLGLIVPAPQPRGPQVEIDLPELQSATDLARASETVVSAAASGVIDIDSAERLLGMLERAAKVREISDLETRIAAIEAEQARQQRTPR